MSGTLEFIKQKVAATDAKANSANKGKMGSQGDSIKSKSIWDIQIKSSTIGQYKSGYNRLDMGSSIFGAQAMDGDRPVMEEPNKADYGNPYFNGNKPSQNPIGLTDKMQMANNFRENGAKNLPPSQASQSDISTKSNPFDMSGGSIGSSSLSLNQPSQGSTPSAPSQSSGASSGGSSNPFG